MSGFGYLRTLTPLSEATPLSFGEGTGMRQNKRIHKSTKKLMKRIRECETELQTIKTLPYYSIFKQEGQRQKDIAAAEKKLEKLREKYSVSSGSYRLAAG